MSDGSDMDIDGCADIEAASNVFTDPLLYHAPLDAFQLMKHSEARQSSSSPPKGWMLTRLFSLAQESAHQSPLSIEELLQHQSDPLSIPLLKTSEQWRESATDMFSTILNLTTQKALPLNDALLSVQKLLQSGLEHNELRDELYMQLFKQARGNEDDTSRLKTWKVTTVVAQTMPPSASFRTLLSHFISQVSRDDKEISEIRHLAAETCHVLKTSVRAGPRKTLPSLEEISVIVAGHHKMKTVVCFLDGTCEELLYDISTTVVEAVERIAALIGLVNCHSFSLFGSQECEDRSEGLDQTLLYDHSYIADVLAGFAARSKQEKASKLVFKKVMFRESDEYILESQFLNLSYLQAQYDFLIGNYPVGHVLAAKLCAFQLFSEYGPRIPQNRVALKAAIQGFTCADMHLTGSQLDWQKQVLDYYHGLQCVSKEDARNCFLTELRSLPYGMAIFYKVTRMRDPIGLLPPRLILGINKNGLHFIRCIPKECLISVDFRDITQLGYSSKSVYFKMRVSGQTHPFQFETFKGEDICAALKTHISDAAGRALAEKSNLDSRNALCDVNFGENYDQYMNKMTKAILEAETRQLSMMRAHEGSMDEIGQSKAQLQNVHLSAQQLHKARDEAQKELSEIHSEMLNLKSQLDSLKASPSRSESGLLRLLMQKEDNFKELLLKVSEETAPIQSQLTETEDRRRQEIEGLKTAIDAIVTEGRTLCTDRETQEAALVEQLANVNAMLHANAHEAEEVKRQTEELRQLRQLHTEVEERERTYSARIEQQRGQIEDLEQRRRSSQLARKKIFNKLQDLKGKIRVYVRVRPVLGQERKTGQSSVVNVADNLSISHPWKREAAQREYTFDGVFPPEAAQTEVFQQTEDLIQSALDGYNVCIFAYGQTGSGKTYTIYGDQTQPGLAPRGIEQLFELMHQNSNKTSFAVTCYMLELYRDSLMDLLIEKKSRHSMGRRFSELPAPAMHSPRESATPRISDCPQPRSSRRHSELLSPRGRLEIKRETGSHQMVRVQGVTTVEVQSAEELMAVFERGQRHRHVAATQMNIQSSRSHLIMSITVESTDLQTLTPTIGKLTFVDLAGSERLKKSGSAGEQLKEAQAINKSLSALGDVISSLARGDAHTPYRNHKLTMLMSDSIGGNAKTLMFVNVSPTDGNLDETQNSLQYATRVRTIKNEATKGVNKETARLKKQIALWKAIDASADSARIHSMLKPYV